MLIDTHAHLNFSAYKYDQDEVIKRSLDEGVQMINIGAQFSTSERAVRLAEKYETGVWSAIGLHPIHLTSLSYEEKNNTEEYKFDSREEKYDREKYFQLAQSKKVVAIGEIGLDYFHNKDNKEDQEKIFREQIGLAVELNLPVIIHCREARLDSQRPLVDAGRAYKEVLEIITEEKGRYKERLRGVVHSYLSRLSYAKEFNDLGFLLGFNGIITFARDYDKVIGEVGLGNMLIETDCPYLTPTPHRGKRNEPSYVKFVAEKIAEIKGVGISEVEKKTTENAKKLFGI
jgi:TatD DNase family protein